MGKINTTSETTDKVHSRGLIMGYPNNNSEGASSKSDFLAVIRILSLALVLGLVSQPSFGQQNDIITLNNEDGGLDQLYTYGPNNSDWKIGTYESGLQLGLSMGWRNYNQIATGRYTFINVGTNGPNGGVNDGFIVTSNLHSIFELNAKDDKAYFRGNVGIGKVAQTGVALDVNGKIIASSDMVANGTFMAAGNSTFQGNLSIIGNVTSLLNLSNNLNIGTGAGDNYITTWSASDMNFRLGSSFSPGFNRDLVTNHVQYITYHQSAGKGFVIGAMNDTGVDESSFEVGGINHQAFFRGNVGIGIANPTAKLEVNGDTRVSGDLFVQDHLTLDNEGGASWISTWNATDMNWRIGLSASPGFTRDLTTASVQYITYNSGIGNGFAMGPNGGQSSFEINASNHAAFFRGNVTIGDGMIVGGLTEMEAIETPVITIKPDMIPTQNGGAWPDYVFAKDYRLSSLGEVEKFVEENHHLPEVPSADDIAVNGYNMAAMDAILLKKIEELTLHLIQMEKKNDELQSLVEQLTSK